MTQKLVFTSCPDDRFTLNCRELIRTKLFTKYQSRLEQITTDFSVRFLEKRKDPETFSLLHNKVLPKPINTFGCLPEEVWYFKAYFYGDESAQIEILIGKFRGMIDVKLLGLHNGHKWTYYPQTTPAKMKLDNAELNS